MFYKIRKILKSVSGDIFFSIKEGYVKMKNEVEIGFVWNKR